ncbi:MAG: PEP-CTERM sorting domain-containing protein [Phycisphaerales bacterium]
MEVKDMAHAGTITNTATALALTLALGSAGAHAANFYEVARIDLASTTNSNNPEYIGTSGAAVAWDSGRLYVAGYNATGSDANVGIVEVTDPLGTPGFGTAFGLILTPNGRSYTGVAFDGDTVSASYDNGTASAVGVQAFEPDGTLRWKVGDTSGNFRGMSGVAADPGFAGSDSGVASQTFGSGRRWLWNETTGANIYNGSSGMVTFVDTSSWRALDFASNGDMYYRGQNDVFKLTRTGGNSGTAAKIADLTNAAGVVGQNIGAVEFGGDTFAIYNDRPGSAGGSFASIVNLIKGDGTPEALNVNWLGGSAPLDGNGYYDFDWDAQTQTLAVFDFASNTVHILAVPEPASALLLGLAGVAGIMRRKA